MKTRFTKHARFLKAKQLADQGNVLGAAKIFRALQVDDPGDPQVKLPLAVALFQLGDYDGTIKVISEYMDLMPEAYFTHQLRGRAFFKLEKFESAIVEFNLEIKKKLFHKPMYHFLGKKSARFPRASLSNQRISLVSLNSIGLAVGSRVRLLRASLRRVGSVVGLVPPAFRSRALAGQRRRCARLGAPV